MLFLCGRCGARYKVSDDKVRGRVLKIRCKKCDALIVLKSPEVAEQPAAAVTAQAAVGGSSIRAAAPARQSNPGAPARTNSIGGLRIARPTQQLTALTDNALQQIWHVAIGREKKGPLTAARVEELISEGALTATSWVWRSGMANWVKLETVVDFQHALAASAAPPPMPPMDDEGDQTTAKMEAISTDAAAAAVAQQQRLEAEAAERARLEAEAVEKARLEAEAAERTRLEAEAAEKARLEAEAAEKARLEAEAAEKARLEAEAAEKARLEAEAAEKTRLEAEAAEKARQEAEAAEKARLEAEAAEKARLEAEAAEKARLEAEAAEKARLEAEAAEKARLEAEAAEKARLEAEAAEKARLEAEEQARLEAEAAEAARLEAEAAEAARLEAEELERLEAEAAEAEAEAARLEAEAIAAVEEAARLEAEAEAEGGSDTVRTLAPAAALAQLDAAFTGPKDLPPPTEVGMETVIDGPLGDLMLRENADSAGDTVRSVFSGGADGDLTGATLEMRVPSVDEQAPVVDPAMSFDVDATVADGEIPAALVADTADDTADDLAADTVVMKIDAAAAAEAVAEITDVADEIGGDTAETEMPPPIEELGPTDADILGFLEGLDSERAAVVEDAVEPAETKPAPTSAPPPVPAAALKASKKPKAKSKKVEDASAAISEATEGGGFFPSAPGGKDIPLLELPSPDAVRPSKHEVRNLIQEFSLMIRLDKRSKRQKIIAGIVAAVLVAAIGGVVWYVDLRNKEAEAERLAKLAQIELDDGIDDEQVTYTVKEGEEEPGKTKDRSNRLEVKTHRAGIDVSALQEEKHKERAAGHKPRRTKRAGADGGKAVAIETGGGDARKTTEWVREKSEAEKLEAAKRRMLAGKHKKPGTTEKPGPKTSGKKEFVVGLGPTGASKPKNPALTDKKVAGLIQRNGRRFQRCKRGGDMTRVRLKFTVGKTGAVDRVSVTSSGFTDARMQKCIRDIVSGWRFPGTGEAKTFNKTIML